MKHYVFLRILKKDTAWGGFEKQILECFERVDYGSARITFVTNYDIHTEYFKKRNLPVSVELFPVADPQKPRMGFWRMYRFLRSLKPQGIIFGHGWFKEFVFSDFLAGFFAAGGNIFVWEVLGAPAPEIKSSKKHFGFIPGIGLWWYRQMMALSVRGWLAKRTITVGNRVRESLVDWYRYPGTKTITAYHGIDTKVFKPDFCVKGEMRKKYNISMNDKVIVSTARLSREKCLDRLIDAFGELRGESNTWLLVIGGGNLKNNLEALAGQKANASRILFLGFQENVLPFLQMSDVFVLPSDIEGLSNAMLEALATGLVAVVTDTPGAREIIEDGKSGFIVEKSTEGVRAGLAKALSLKTEERDIFLQNALHFIRGHFDLERGTRKELELMEIPYKGNGRV